MDFRVRPRANIKLKRRVPFLAEIEALTPWSKLLEALC